MADETPLGEILDAITEGLAELTEQLDEQYRDMHERFDHYLTKIEDSLKGKKRS